VKTHLLFAVLSCTILSQFSFAQVPTAPRSSAVDAQMASVANLPAHKITPNDLIGVSVYDLAQLTRTVRVGPDGMIDLPMIENSIHAQGLLPRELEGVIATALKDEKIMVNPIVTVTILEYDNRVVSVVGAVHKPLTLQITGTTRLLDALAKAEWLTPEAGPDLLLSRPGDSVPMRINLKELLSGSDSTLNVELSGNEQIRIPEARKIYVIGDVKKPAAVPIRENAEFTVLKVLAVVEVTTTFSSPTIWIYRMPEGKKDRVEIPVELKKILARKSPDVPLLPDDILYIPDRTGTRITVSTAEKMSGLAGSIIGGLIYAGHL
jgi:polysaccharide export outer membrane protein